MFLFLLNIIYSFSTTKDCNGDTEESNSFAYFTVDIKDILSDVFLDSSADLFIKIGHKLHAFRPFAPTVYQVHNLRRFILKQFLILPFVVLLLPAPVFAETSITVVAITRGPNNTPVSLYVKTTKSLLASTIAELRNRPGVIAAGISAHRQATDWAPDPELISQWGFTRVGGETLNQTSTGEGIIVAVLDTGVDATHPDLTGRVLTGWNSMNTALPGTGDPNGHGTHVAGIIAATSGNGIGVAGMAPNVQILPVKVLDENGNGDDDQLALGIIWAVDHGANILNLSIGGAVPSTLLSDSITYAVAASVIVVVAAGNNGAFGNEPSYPAAYVSTLAVGSTDSNDTRSIFSNTGSYVDIVAPGSWIKSTWTGGGYQYSSGTSMSAPFVAGAAAVLESKTGLRGLAIENMLTSSALDLGAPGRDNEFGFGLLDPLAALGLPRPVAPSLSSPFTPNLPSFSLPNMPTLPAYTLPMLPNLPVWTLPNMPKLPALPNLISPILVPNPSLVIPVLPDLVPSSSVNTQLGLVSLQVTSSNKGTSYTLQISLIGSRALIARQPLLVTINGRMYSVVSNINGKAQLRVRSSSGARYIVDFIGSLLVPALRVSNILI